MNVNELMKYAIIAKDEYDEQIDAFVAKLKERTDNPEDYITMREFEEFRKLTGLSNHKTLTDFSSKALEIMDTKELNDSKKECSSSSESN